MLVQYYTVQSELSAPLWNWFLQRSGAHFIYIWKILQLKSTKDFSGNAVLPVMEIRQMEIQTICCISCSSNGNWQLQSMPDLSNDKVQMKTAIPFRKRFSRTVAKNLIVSTDQSSTSFLPLSISSLLAQIPFDTFRPEIILRHNFVYQNDFVLWVGGGEKSKTF